MILLRFIQAVKLAALMENRGFRRVQVLGRIVAQHAAAETNYASALVADRKHDALAKAVIGAALIVGNQHAGFHQGLAILFIAAEAL